MYADRSDKTQRSEDREELPATADTERWEGDGGASTGARREDDGVRGVCALRTGRCVLNLNRCITCSAAA